MNKDPVNHHKALGSCYKKFRNRHNKIPFNSKNKIMLYRENYNKSIPKIDIRKFRSYTYNFIKTLSNDYQYEDVSRFLS